MSHRFIETADFLSYINREKVKDAINSFGWNKSAGPDDIKPVVLQNLDNKSLDRLTLLYKVSMALGYTPKAWCKSKIIFIPKLGKESYDNPKSMRPISLTSFMFKGLERLNHWEVNEVHKLSNKMHNMQFAFST